MAKAATAIRSARRRALRKRYGYAALRVVRAALRRAIARHKEYQMGADPTPENVTSIEELSSEYWTALKMLRKRWPHLDVSDPRAEP